MIKDLPGWKMCALSLALPIAAQANTTIEYLVPPGFSLAEQDQSMQLLGNFNGKALPGPITWSNQQNRLEFDEALYRQNGLTAEQLALLNRVLTQVPYSHCEGGCDYTLAGQTVVLNKVDQSISITDGSLRYVLPATTLGFVHNQSFDVRTASNDFHSVNAFGQGYLGLPAQAYGFVSWYYNNSKSEGEQFTDQGVSTWYLQKNFATTYLRGGQQDSRDSAAGSVSTVLNPSFDQFITLGSQNNLARDNKSAGKLVLFASTDGDYEFWRDGRLIRRLPAQIGRNEIDYNQLPGGYYTLEIRLVNRSGQVVSRESQAISNISYGGGTGWYLTLGKAQNTMQKILNGGISFTTSWFSVSSALLKGTGRPWAMEHNITRPMRIAGLEVVPTLGVLSGESGVGGYASLSGGNEDWGYLSISRYQDNQVSEFYQAYNSTTLAYARQFGKTRLGYNYHRYAFGEQHQLQGSWNVRASGAWAVISAGVQKGGYNDRSNNYGLYLNTTVMLDQSSGTLNAAYSKGRLHTGGTYEREFEDNFGTTHAGVSFSELGRTNDVGLTARRSGTRGDASVRVGVDDKVTSGSLNYSGMLAANAGGIALGRTSTSGAAMLVTTPSLGEIDYGFKVEDMPVAGGSTYAVPVGAYQDLTFARTQAVDKSLDMNIRLPANVVRAHPGQVYGVKADVELNLLYNGFFVDSKGLPVSGTLQGSGELVHPNGLFSITSKVMLKEVQVQGKSGRYRCDLSKPRDNYYTCVVG